MAKFYREKRVPLVLAVLARANGQCQIKWDEHCDGVAEGVHEIMSRGRGGGIMAEGVNAMENVQAACHWCNEQVSLHAVEAKARGFLRSAGGDL